MAIPTVAMSAQKAEPLNEKHDQKPISVLVIGAGPAGLVNARTLIQDGFNVTIVCKEEGVGGQWHSCYPTLHTNNAWGAFTFSGLDMPMPSNSEGLNVPARTYQRYLEDFYEYFVKDRAEFLPESEVTNMKPRSSGRGWDTIIRIKGQETQRSFDRVLLAVGYLGKPRIPQLLQSSPIPVYHTASLSETKPLNTLLDSIPSSDADPTVEGDSATILVMGGGKSGMDIAALLANRGRKVVWTFKGPMKWFAPLFRPGMMGAGRLDALFGPKRVNDSWTLWFYHCTWLGARLVKSFWAMLRSGWSTLYHDKMPAPPTDPYLALPHFAGGMPLESTDFQPLVKSGRIAALPLATPMAITSYGVEFSTNEGPRTIHCGAIVAATGYVGSLFECVDPIVRAEIGLNKVPPRPGCEDRVRAMRRKWKTVPGDEVAMTEQALVYRGMLPVGRWKERDLAVVGATRPLSSPAITYEVESHWISSLFKDDPYLRLPATQEEMIDECHADNEFNLARFPGIDPYALIGGGTYFAGFNDQYMHRCILRDLNLDPWRQKSKLPWWNIRRLWDWIDVRIHPEQYASIGQERRARWSE